VDTAAVGSRRRAITTHWRYAAQLASRYPAIDVDPGVLYVDDGQVITSAGTAAGIDACLHLLRLEHGAAVANAVARHMVPPHRDGGHPQPLARTGLCCRGLASGAVTIALEGSLPSSWPSYPGRRLEGSQAIDQCAPCRLSKRPRSADESGLRAQIETWNIRTI
jgi:hypothetical protein